jgi:hypothetical protein
MKPSILAAVLITCATSVAAQQQQPAKKPTTLTLSGCVQKSETVGGGFTLADGEATYRLTGVDVRDYVGRRVQVVGGAPRRLKIVGGLSPSANVAGQAGDMDPTRAAMASAEGANKNGTGVIPEFRIKSIQPLAGTCPQ